MSGMSWLPFETTILEDPAFMRLPPEAQAAWFKMEILAARLLARGKFIKDGRVLTVEDIAFLLHEQNLITFQSAVDALKSVGRLSENGRGLELTDFAKKQRRYEKQQEGNRKRQAEFRARQPKSNTLHERYRPVSHADIPDHTIPDSDSIPDQDQEVPGQSTNQPTSEAIADDEAGVVGELETRLTSDGIQNINQRKVGRLAYRILGASGLGNPKLLEASVYMATRILSGEMPKALLAALASAYADDSAKNKPLIALDRIKRCKVDPHYEKADTWKVIPPKVLKAAGIDSLTAYLYSEFSK